MPCIAKQTYFPPYRPLHCNKTEQAFITQWGQAQLAALAPVLQSKRNGLFLVSCIQHGINADINGVTQLEALTAWRTRGAVGKDSGYKFRDCCGPDGAGGVPCNEGTGCAPWR